MNINFDKNKFFKQEPAQPSEPVAIATPAQEHDEDSYDYNKTEFLIVGFFAIAVAIGFPIMQDHREKVEKEAFSHMNDVEKDFYRFCKEVNRNLKPALITEANINYTQYDCVKETKGMSKIPKEELEIFLPNTLIR
jgi:hypothetical protein